MCSLYKCALQIDVLSTLVRIRIAAAKVVGWSKTPASMTRLNLVRDQATCWGCTVAFLSQKCLGPTFGHNIITTERSEEHELSSNESIKRK